MKKLIVGGLAALMIGLSPGCKQATKDTRSVPQDLSEQIGPVKQDYQRQNVEKDSNDHTLTKGPYGLYDLGDDEDVDDLCYDTTKTSSGYLDCLYEMEVDY